MSLRTILATALTIGLLTPAAFAQSPAAPAPPDHAGRPAAVGARQKMQLKRIQAGQKRGTISTAERRRLLAMERQIRTLAQQLRESDGKLTGQERARLQRELNRVSRAIRRAGRG